MDWMRHCVRFHNGRSRSDRMGLVCLLGMRGLEMVMPSTKFGCCTKLDLLYSSAKNYVLRESWAVLNVTMRIFDSIMDIDIYIMMCVGMWDIDKSIVCCVFLPLRWQIQYNRATKQPAMASRLIWHRRDLRIRDNELYHSGARTIFSLFIFDPSDYTPRPTGYLRKIGIK